MTLQGNRCALIWGTAMIMAFGVLISKSGIAQSPSNPMHETFDAAFNSFMKALATKDRATFQSFLAPDAFAQAILPPSRSYTSLAAYEASQDHWFESRTGSFEFKVIRTEEADRLAFGLVKATYSNVDTSGKPFTMELWISFVFRKSGNGWKMMFVQNTPISTDPDGHSSTSVVRHAD